MVNPESVVIIPIKSPIYILIVIVAIKRAFLGSANRFTTSINKIITILI